jgi:putative PIG3 family NAD(P)H quinone oxidoreductase
MRAIVVTGPGGPENLVLTHRPDPSPGRCEVLVRIHAAGVNRADLLQRMGRYRAPPDAPSDIPGLEYAGTVEAVGECVTELSVGERVFGLAPGGTYAELLVVHSRAVARLPSELSFVQGAAVPEAFVTAYDSLVSQGGLAAGDHVLVHAAGSGVGTAAVQIGRAVGATVLGTARSAWKLERATQLGLRRGFVVGEGRFADKVLEATSGHGVDVVLELVGGRNLAEDIRCIAIGGRIIVVGTLGGATAELDLGPLMRRRVTVRGTVLRSRPIEERIQVMRVFEQHVVPLFAAMELFPVVDRVFPLACACDAHACVAADQSFGKVVLEVVA